MSQAKVERYKQEKKNRKAELKKQKRKKVLGCIIAILICAAIAVWIGFSAYSYHQEHQPVKTTSINVDAIQNFIKDNCQ